MTIARALTGLTGVAVVMQLVLLAANPRQAAEGEFGFPGYQVIFAISDAWIGYLIAMRQRHNPVGWSLLVAALAIGIDGLAHEYALRPATGALHDLAIWIDQWTWAVNTAGLLFALQRFPDGRPVGPRWGWLGPFTFASCALAVLLSALVPGRIVSSGLENPFGVAALSSIPSSLTNAPPLPATVLTLVSLVVRLRRSRGIERQQLKWLVAAMATVALWAVAMVAAQGPAPGLVPLLQDGLVLLTPLIAISIGIAILRYRLYEIDTIINRALVYGALTAILAGVYTAAIKVFQLLFVAATGERSDAAIVVTTLALAAAFTPLKSWLQTHVDRRFKPLAKTTASGSDAAVLGEIATLRAEIAQLRDELRAPSR